MPRFQLIIALLAALCCFCASCDKPANNQSADNQAAAKDGNDSSTPAAEAGPADQTINPSELPDPDHKPPRQYTAEELARFEEMLAADSAETRNKLVDDGAMLDADHLIDYISMGRMNIVARMIASGMDLNRPASNGKRPLAEAILQNDPWLVEQMISHGADPTLSDDPEHGVGRSMLHYATKMNNPELVKRLVELGVPADSTDVNDQTPLDVAATYGETEAMAVLLANGADPLRMDRGGSVPVLLAAGYGHTDAVRQLLKHGADINFQHERGWTPLLLSIYYDQLDTAQFVLDNGGDINAQLETGYGAAGIAATLGDPEMLRLVIDAGAPLDDITAQDGRNLVHICAINNLASFIPELAEAGVDPAATDNEGKTPLELAREAADSEAEQLLMELTGAPPAPPETEGAAAAEEVVEPEAGSTS
ncbi:ankyrin repeat domain-containing protein [bacterium]|nr:ankyrin repeat domain-containing protein [bacterium]